MSQFGLYLVFITTLNMLVLTITTQNLRGGYGSIYSELVTMSFTYEY